MRLGPSRWECQDCGRKHERNRKQCVNCGYVVLAPVDEERRLDELTSIGLALLPAIMSILTMGLLAWVLFF